MLAALKGSTTWPKKSSITGTGTLMKLIKIDLAQVCENVSVRKKATLMGHGYFFTASFVAC